HGETWNDVPELHEGFYTYLSTQGPNVLVRTIHESLGGRYFQSDDDGFIWTEVDVLPWDSIMTDMQIFGSYVYARKHSGGTVRSGDHGVTWEWVHPERIGFIVDGDRMYRSKNAVILESSDGGFSWDTMLVFPQNVGMSYKKAETLIVKNGFQNTSVSISEDGGLSWKTFSADADDFSNFDVLLPFQGRVFAFEQVHYRAWVTDAASGAFEQRNLPSGTATAFGVISLGDKLLRSTIHNGLLHSTDGVNWAKSTGVNDGQIHQIKLYEGQLYAPTFSGLYKLLPDKHHWLLVAPEYELKEVKDVVASGNNLVVSTWAGQIWYSSDGGQSFQWAKDEDGENIWSMERMEMVGSRIFGWSDAFDGINGPRYSDDMGKTWKYLYPILPATNLKKMDVFDGQLYLLTLDGLLYRWEVQSLAFVPLANTPVPFVSPPFSFLPSYYEAFYVKGNVCVVTEPLDNTQFDYNYFVSSNGGQSWNQYPRIVTTGIYEDGFWSDIEISGDTIFVALHNNGVYFSPDFGVSWQPFSEGLWRKSASLLALFEGELFVGGDGVYRRKTNGELPTVPSAEPIAITGSNAFPNPFSDHFSVQMSMPVPWTTVRLYDMLGRPIALSEGNVSDDEILFSGMGHLPRGVYFLEIESGESSSVKKLMKY
ncbi:MAG: T9SS type A sorting domain-containing protein, partial [Saprospiraceae bacterium]|nr:T9SS type A sorting domain-containing protein [Saprospiraceae bacterium]